MVLHRSQEGHKAVAGLDGLYHKCSINKGNSNSGKLSSFLSLFEVTVQNDSIRKWYRNIFEVRLEGNYYFLRCTFQVKLHCDKSLTFGSQANAFVNAVPLWIVCLTA